MRITIKKQLILDEADVLKIYDRLCRLSDFLSDTTDEAVDLEQLKDEFKEFFEGSF